MVDSHRPTSVRTTSCTWDDGYDGKSDFFEENTNIVEIVGTEERFDREERRVRRPDQDS